MTEEMNTKDLSDRELLELMRRDLNSINARLEQMDGRLGTLEARTNPLPPNYDEPFAALEKDVKDIKRGNAPITRPQLAARRPTGRSD